MMSTYWWERSIVGATMDQFWKELRTHFHGGPLDLVFSIPDIGALDGVIR